MHMYPRILQVSTADVLGGAERIAWNLHREYTRRGHESAMAVGRRETDDPLVFAIPNERAGGPWRRFWWRLHRLLQPMYGRSSAARYAVRLAHRLAEPQRMIDALRGYEDFHYPGTRQIVDACPFEPDVIHCHNLHGKYFDLWALPQLAGRRPTFLTLHDAWLMAGHCAHSFDCERWKTGCGDCPDLSIYPAIRRDATARNWRVKRDIHRQARLNVATPSRWLRDTVEQSMLAPACADLRVIPNGVDVSVYNPGDKREARGRLGLPQNAHILLFAGYRPSANPWKDFRTLHEAVDRIASEYGAERVVCLSVGGSSHDAAESDAVMRHVPFVGEEGEMADYYRAADVYVHAARVDTFPNSVLEAMACGTPVVATAVGGIPEQIVAAEVPGGSAVRNTYGHGGEANPTGILVPPGDAGAMAHAVSWLLRNDGVRALLSSSAVADVVQRFTLSRQADAYMEWYTSVLGDHNTTRRRGEPGPRRRGVDSLAIRGQACDGPRVTGSLPRLGAGPRPVRTTTPRVRANARKLNG
jgi:glycosyltransferase involved in cell wall biosynthesis